MGLKVYSFARRWAEGPSLSPFAQLSGTRGQNWKQMGTTNNPSFWWWWGVDRERLRHLVMLRGDSWYCTQELLLAILRGPYGIVEPGIKCGLTLSKAGTCCTVALCAENLRGG